MTDSFDMSGLLDLINKIKKEGEKSTEFTLECLQCLLERHDLKYSIHLDFEVVDVPFVILESLRQGILPSKEQICLLDDEVQSNFIAEMIWVCGMNTISYYTRDIPPDEDGETVLDQFLVMLEVSESHFIGCYLISALTLLMGNIPSIEMIETITDNFNNNPQHIAKSLEIFYEFIRAIHSRWKEDKLNYESFTQNFKEV
jgi:hypothetical protein